MKNRTEIIHNLQYKKELKKKEKRKNLVLVTAPNQLLGRTSVLTAALCPDNTPAINFNIRDSYRFVTLKTVF